MESDFGKFESLFPEFREVDKLKRPDVSPTYNPFRREASPEVPPAEGEAPIVSTGRRFEPQLEEFLAPSEMRQPPIEEEVSPGLAQLFPNAGVPPFQIPPEDISVSAKVTQPLTFEEAVKLPPIEEEEPEVAFRDNPVYWLYKRNLLPDIMFSSLHSQQAIKRGEQGLPSVGKTDLEEKADAIRQKQLATDPNPIIRIANTPTVVGGLTPAQISGIAAIAYGLWQVGSSLVNSFTQLRRLPEYKAMVQFAKDNNIPRDSKVFKDAESALKSAINLHRGGAKEAASEIMSRYYTAYSKTTPPTRLPPTQVAPFVPRGTQTGALAFGGKRLLTPQQISDFRVGIDKVVREGNKTFVIDTEGVRKKVEVQSDVMTSEFAENVSRLNPEQKAKMIEQVETTPYLSDEGRAERLDILKATPTPEAVPEVTGEVVIPQLISDPSGTVDKARPTAAFFPEIKPSTKLPVGTVLRVTVKAVGEKQISFWAQVEERGGKSNIYTRLDKESQIVTKKIPEGEAIQKELVFHGAIVREQLARENVLLGELQVVKLAKPPAVEIPKPEAPQAISEGVKLPIEPPVAEEIAAEVITPPPTKPPPTAVEAAIPPTEDPVVKLTNLIKTAKPVRAETELLKHEELSRRAGALAGAIRAGEGEQAFLRAKGVLKGELPQAAFEPPRPQMTPDDIKGLFNKIRDSDLLPFQKLNTSEALSAILGGKLPTRGDIALLEQMFGSDLAKALLAHRPLSQKAWDVFLEVWNITRTLMASGELSASLRQGALLAPSHPKIFARTMWAQLRAAAKEKNALAIDRAMQTNPGAELRAQYKVFHAPLSGVGAKLTQREEVFLTKFFETFVTYWEQAGLATKIGASPLYLIAKGVRIFERAYITFLNKMRVDIFDTTVATWRKTGEPPLPEELQRLSNFVNDGTGRGRLGKLEESAPVLSGAFFSPRLQASRIGFFWDAMKDTVRAINDLAHGRPVNRMAKENLKAVAAFVGVGLMVLGILKLNGWEVSDDSNSADFGKAKKGKTRIDIWSSFQPYARFISNMITSTRTSTITGATLEVNRMKVMKSFLRSKLMPSMGYIWDVLEGRTYEGEDIEFSVDQAVERLAPMWWQDMYEAIEEEGLVGGFYALPGFFGVGIQTYDLPSWPELEDYFYIEDTLDKKGNVIKTATAKRMEWRIQYPENEAKLFILGRLTVVKTAGAALEVLKIVEEHKIKPTDIRAVKAWQEGDQRGEDLTDALIKRLLSPEEVRTPEEVKTLEPPGEGAPPLSTPGETYNPFRK